MSIAKGGQVQIWSLENALVCENGTYFRLGYQEDGVKPKCNLEADWGRVKKEREQTVDYIP